MSKLKRCVFIFIVNLLCVITISAQQHTLLKGNVVDSLYEPIPYANVFTQAKDNTTILTFGSTDEKGNFAIQMPSLTAFLLKISALGYGETTILLDSISAKKAQKIRLKTQEIMLRAAIIKGTNKIVDNGDTITFKADRFRDSTERNVEELLAKIPGVEVDKNTGAISVQGQSIKKILIEGDDLTGRNYQLISKNMAADVIDKIQIIDRFTENKLLKGIERSDDKVINITLKEGRKKLLFGNANIGVGNDRRTDNATNLFGIYEKLKTITFGNFNTTGKISTPDYIDMDFKDNTQAENQRSLIKTQNQKILDIGRAPMLTINSQSVRFNKASLISTHFIIHPVKTVQLKGILSFNNDHVNSYSNNDFSYLLKGNTFNIAETNTILRKPTVIEEHFEAQIDINKNSSLRYKNDVRKSIAYNLVQTTANNNAVTSSLDTRGLSFANTFDYTYRINETQAMTANVTVITENTEQTLSTQQNIARLTPIVNLRADALSQNINSPFQYYAANGQWLLSKNTLKFSTYVGSVFKKDDFMTRLDGSLQNKALLLPNTFQNKLSVQQSNHYIGVNISKNWQEIDWLLSMSGGFYTYNVKGKIEKARVYGLPTIGFKKKISDEQSVFGTYAYNYALPQIHDLTSGYFLTDYRKIERGSAVFIPAYSTTGIVNYKFRHYSDGFLWHLNLLHNRSIKGYANNWGINPDFNIAEKTENMAINRNSMLSGSIERYIAPMYLRVKIRPKFTMSNYTNTLNLSENRNTNVTNSSIDISIRSGFLKWFNYHVGSTFTQTKSHTQVGNTQNENKNYSVGSFLDFYLKFNQRLNGKIDNEFFYVRQQNSPPQQYYFTNIWMMYDLIPAKMTLSITAKNLLNTQEFINSYVTDYSTQINRIRLLPRYVLVEMNFRF